jgi:hypothetical protein
MPATVWKILNKNSPGTGNTFGADDWDMPGRWHNDVDLSATAPSSVKTNTSFWDNRLRIWNPAKTKSYRIRGLAILNDYDAILPLLTANDEFTMNLATQELQNKTINVNLNTLRNTSNSVGQLLVGDGSKYLPLNMGGSAGHVLKINPGVNGLEWGSVAGGGGETNTASNVGTAGVGVFKQKTGVNLEFKKINTASGGLITVVDDTGSSEVDLKITPGSNGQVLTTTGGVPVWATPAGSGRTMPDGTAYSGARWGAWIGGGWDGDGQFTGHYEEGTRTADIGTALSRTGWITDAVDADLAGWQTWLRITRRSQTPRYKIKLSNTPSTERLWVGFIDSDTYPGGASPLLNRSGAMIGYGESDANFQVKWNNGGAATQTAATAVVKDTALHTAEILLDEATGSVSAWFDGTQVVNANTTQAPATGTLMAIHNWTQAVGATATTVRMEYAQLTYP